MGNHTFIFMSALIGIAVVIGLCLWILGDMAFMRRRKIAAPRPMDPSDVKAKQLTQARVFMIGLGMAVYAMAYNEWMNPSHPPFSGKLASVYSALYQAFGPYAQSAFFVVVGTVFVLIGVLKQSNALSPKSMHTDATRK